MRAGAAWLESEHRRGKPLPEGLHGVDVVERLRHFFIEADPAFICALQDRDTTSLSPEAFRTAVKIAAEYQLGLWVRNENLLGAAVRTTTMIEEFNTVIASRQWPHPLQRIGSSDASTGRNWAFRWRKRNGAKFGKLKVQEDVSLEEKRDKALASHFCTPGGPHFLDQQATKNRTNGRRNPEPTAPDFEKKCAQFLDRKLVPRIPKWYRFIETRKVSAAGIRATLFEVPTKIAVALAPAFAPRRPPPGSGTTGSRTTPKP